MYTSLEERIFKFTSKLKEVKNQRGDKYYINPQLPEPCNQNEGNVMTDTRKLGGQMPISLKN